MYKIMLIHPPGRKFQRGEDRCQANIDDSTSTAIRACNDLGYVSSILKENGYEIFLKDYPVENLTFNNLLDDFNSFSPNLLFISTTNSTIFEDIQIANQLKNVNLTIILKGAIFFNIPHSVLNEMDLKNIDYLIGGESEFIIDKLVNSLVNDDYNAIKKIEGIIFKEKDEWKTNKITHYLDDLDKIPFPDRDLMKNNLYVRPDTNEPQATISTSRGCSSSCTYCLTPLISGNKVRFRSPENVLTELIECYNKYNIKNFFFKSDTFTINKKWVIELCHLICKSELNKKISWVANSRTRPIDLETLNTMKKAGCWLIAFGFESGSIETMQKIKKGATVDDSLNAAELAKKAGLKIFGFYMIGFPWEKINDLNNTKKLIYKINADFIEIHIAIPFYGTPLYKQVNKKDFQNKDIIGKDYFSDSIINGKYLTGNEIINFRKKTLLQYHLRLSYIFKKFVYCLSRPKVFTNYIKFGLRMIKSNI